MHLTIYSSGTASCISGLKGLEISIDWYATLGRCASRYLTTTIAWAAGVSSLTLFLGLGKYDRGGALCMLNVELSTPDGLLFDSVLHSANAVS